MANTIKLLQLERHFAKNLSKTEISKMEFDLGIIPMEFGDMTIKELHSIVFNLAKKK